MMARDGEFMWISPKFYESVSKSVRIPASQMMLIVYISERAAKKDRDHDYRPAGD